jgi:hypothetical protein
MPAWSPSGDRLAFAGSCSQPDNRLARGLQVLPRTGRGDQQNGLGVSPLTGPGQSPGLLPRLAWARLRDGSDAIITPRQSGDSINLFRVSLNGEFVPLTSGGGLEHWPVVSPSGELVFTRTEVTPSVWSHPLAPSREPPRREAAPARMFGTCGTVRSCVRPMPAPSRRPVSMTARRPDIVLASHDDIWNGGAGPLCAGLPGRNAGRTSGYWQGLIPTCLY